MSITLYTVQKFTSTIALFIGFYVSDVLPALLGIRNTICICYSFFIFKTGKRLDGSKLLYLSPTSEELPITHSLSMDENYAAN